MSVKTSKNQLCNLGNINKINNSNCLSKPQKNGSLGAKADSGFNKKTLSKAMLYSQMVRNISQSYNNSQNVSTFNRCSTSRTLIPVNNYSRFSSEVPDVLQSGPNTVLPNMIANFEIDATFTDISTNIVTIYWTGIGCDVNVEYYTTLEPTKITYLNNISSHSFTIYSLLPNTTYKFKLRPTFNGIYGILHTLTCTTHV